MNLRVKSTDVATLIGRPLFFDANVLLYLFSPSAANSQQQWAITAYSAVFKHALTRNLTLCIDVMVLSEFINRFLRLEHQGFLKRNGSAITFKAYRATSDGLLAAQDIEDIVTEKLLKSFKIIGKLFNSSEIGSIHLPNTDFNDALIVETCKAHQCVLVTNDADFLDANIDILTANNKLSKT